MAYAGTSSPPDTIGADLNRTARTTGLLYPAFFVTGISGSVLVRGQPFAAADAQGTLPNLMEHGALARAGIVLELSIGLTQVLTAVWFYRLFRGVDTPAAGHRAVVVRPERPSVGSRGRVGCRRSWGGPWSRAAWATWSAPSSATRSRTPTSPPCC